MEFDDRYGPNWQKLPPRAYKLQGGRCAACGKAFEQHEGQLHHFHYVDEMGSLLNDEMLPGKDGVWLCGAKQDVGTCHHRVHQKDLWRVDGTDPVRLNHNTPELVAQLQRNWRSLTGLDPRVDRPNLQQAIALKLPQSVEERMGRNAVQAIPTTPESIGTAEAPEQWYEHDGKLINAPIAGDLSAGYTPSEAYRSRLEAIDELAAKRRFRQQENPLAGVWQGFQDLILPGLFLFTFFLVIWIAS
jgi:hypothetical protein